ncbi:MAG: hypothetical protein HY906_17255 [Deltaproteobacteria bacterium]|nr:hypothetical protein [Deltaproteobacteria bacterium]
MDTRETGEAKPDERQPYEPPRIEEVLEFETTALAACSKQAGVSLCDLNPPTAS